MEGGCRKRKASVVPDEKEEFTKVDISISLVPGNPFNSSLIWGISFLLGELAATSLPRPGWLRMHLQVGAGVRLQVDPGIHRTTLREFRFGAPGRGGGGGGSDVTRNRGGWCCLSWTRDTWSIYTGSSLLVMLLYRLPRFEEAAGLGGHSLKRLLPLLPVQLLQLLLEAWAA